MAYDKIEKKKISDKSHLKKRKEALFHFPIPALANDDMVTFFDTEAGWDMGRDVGMPLLISDQNLKIRIFKKHWW